MNPILSDSIASPTHLLTGMHSQSSPFTKSASSERVLSDVRVQRIVTHIRKILIASPLWTAPILSPVGDGSRDSVAPRGLPCTGDFHSVDETIQYSRLY